LGRRLTEEDDKIIRDLYLNKKKSSVEIGKILKTSHKTVLNHLEKLKIPRRSLSEAHFAYNDKEYPPEFEDYEFMYDIYVTQYKTKEQTGEYFDCAPHVIDRVLKNLNIHIRDASESKIGVQRGSEHHNWQGGITPLNLRCREYLKRNIWPKIKERDNYTCQLCGCSSELHVHHIIPLSEIIEDITEQYPDLDIIKDVNQMYEIVIANEKFLNKTNLITYCKNCHLFKIHKYKKTTSS